MLGWLRNKWQRDLVTLRERREKAAQKHRDRKILCPRCGYDIKGMPDQPCSECGLFIESKWREGRYAAGSVGRKTIPWILGYLGAKSFLLFGIVTIVTGSLIKSLPMRPWEIEPRYWVLHVLVLNQALVGLGVLVIAITKRRWLTYGPRSYAVRTELAALALLVGSGEVMRLVARMMAD